MRGGGVIAGHGRLEAATALGMLEVPCIEIAGLTESQRRALVIADNKLAMNAGWDSDILSSEIALLNAASFDLDILGFSDSEIHKFLSLAPESNDSKEDEAPPPAERVVSVAGDLWRLGDHRLMCGDSLNVDSVKRLAEASGCKVDMLLTDPPYNVAYVGKAQSAMTIKNDSMGSVEFQGFLAAAFKAADAVMKAGAVFYIWHADAEGYNFRGACMQAGWVVRQCLIWKKQTMVLGRQDYHWIHEPCLYGWKAGAGHLWAADRKQVTVLEFDRPMKNADHPTMKPVALFEYQLLNNTKGGDVVLDLFGGSGTTLIAAEKHGRTALLMELDPKFVDVIVRRWQAFTGRKATLEQSGQTFEQVASTRLN